MQAELRHVTQMAAKSFGFDFCKAERGSTRFYMRGKTDGWEPEETAEDVDLAEIFNIGLLRCVDTPTGAQEMPEVSLPLEAVQDACVSRVLWQI